MRDWRQTEKDRQRQTSPYPTGKGALSLPCFLTECRKKRLKQGSFVLQYYVLFGMFVFCVVFSLCISHTVCFVSISQVIGCEDRGLTIFAGYDYDTTQYKIITPLIPLPGLSRVINSKVTYLLKTNMVNDKQD